MFDQLIRGSLRHRVVVLLLAVALLVWGGRTLTTLPVDVLPDLNRPTVTLLTEAHGLSPEEVEVRVTLPLESAMRGAPGVERVRSQSAPGLSVVWIELGWDEDIWRGRQQVAERLAQVQGELPEETRPAMGAVSSIMGEILLLGLVSPDGQVAGPALRTLADSVLRPRILSIPGVSQVTVIGGGVEQLQVELDPSRMVARGVTLAEVRDAVAGAQGNTSGGFVARKSQEYLVRNLARSSDPEVIGQTVVGDVGVRLFEVATVQRGVAPARGDAGVNGEPAVILSVQKQPGIASIQLTEAVERAVGLSLSGAELPGLPGLPGLGLPGPGFGNNGPPGPPSLLTGAIGLPEGVRLVSLFRQADFIEAAIGNVEEALLEGAVLVALVLMVFLLNVRTTVITLTAIPLSLLTAAMVLHTFGLSINTMTLGGLAVAVGELVDDAIVDVENVLRRLRENARSLTPRPALEVIAAASGEVRNAIVFSTALVVLVFIPLFAIEGMEGRLFLPLGLAYIIAILASMFVSLTVTPVMCAWLLPGLAARSAEGEPDGRLVRLLKGWDRRLLETTLDWPRLLLGGVTIAAVIAALSVPFLGRSFLPPFNEGTATINLMARPGTSLTESNRLGQIAERLLLEVPEVASVGRRTGRAELDDHAEGVHYSEIDVDFRLTLPEGAPRPRPEVLADVRARLASIPGVSVSLGQPIGHRLDHLISGVRAAIAIKIFGHDLSVLRGQAAVVEAALRDIPGLVDLQLERQVLIPQIDVTVDPFNAARYGVRPGELVADLETALAGHRAAQLVEGPRRLDLVVRLAESDRVDPRVIADLPLVRPIDRQEPGQESGQSREHAGFVTLGQVARVETTTGPNQVLHEDGQRRIVLSANTAGRDAGSVVADVEAALAGLSWPEGTWPVVSGQHERQREATRQILLLSVLSLGGMIGLLFAHFRSWPIVAQVLVNVPLALPGSVAALWISGQPLSVATLVGFITLCGLVSRNTILMISHYQHLMVHEGVPFGRDMVIRGSLERLVPVTMTAVCAGLGLIPLVLAGGDPGKEILTPVAQVIFGGLVSSTLLDVVVTPALFYRYGRDLRPQLDPHLQENP